MNAWYMSGAGNDFMVIDARGLTLDFTKLAQELCKKMECDGFMAVDNSDIAHFRLHFYTADGSRGEMCGNGSRCVAKFAYDHGIAPENMTIETDAGLLTADRIGENQYRVRLNNPGIVDLHRHGDMAYVELGNPGVPHAVAEYDGDLWADADCIWDHMKQLRWDAAFPKGANVNFYQWIGDAEVRVLTFERGVEDYTLACGTGSASTAVKLWLEGKVPGGCLTVKNPGGDLAVTIVGTDRVEELYLEGPTEVVREYEL